MVKLIKKYMDSYCVRDYKTFLFSLKRNNCHSVMTIFHNRHQFCDIIFYEEYYNKLIEYDFNSIVIKQHMNSSQHECKYYHVAKDGGVTENVLCDTKFQIKRLVVIQMK